jgi:hypothetical protein
MQLLWILPSLGYGIYLWVTTGQFVGIIFGALSCITMVLNFFFQNRKRQVGPNDPLWFSGDRVAIGNQILPKAEWRWKTDWIDRVYQEVERQVAERNSAISLNEKISASLTAIQINPLGLSAWLGFDSTTPLELDLVEEGFHGVIIGATGSGKSQLLTGWLRSLCEAYDPTQLALALFDYKGGACLGPFSRSPQSRGFATDLDQNAASLLNEISLELVQREQMLAAEGLSRIQDLPTQRLPPRLLVVVDEVLPLLSTSGAVGVLDAIASRGRSLGVHLLVTGQSLSGIPRNLLSNLGARFLVGKPDPVEMAQLGMGRLEGVAAAPVEGWASAIMATNRRQLRFTFSSAGKINKKNFFEPKIVPHAPNGNSAGSKSTDSAALPSNIYDFSSSFE